MYEITDYTQNKAKQLGVKIAPSKNPKKKLDVFKDNKKVASVGATSYMDYPTYKEKKGKAFADERRRLYKIRHADDRMVKGSAGYYADKLLW
jgi:hypothetical protein